MAPMVDQAIPVAPDLRTTAFPAEFTPGARNAVVLESLAPRPLIEMPATVLDDMETSQVSIFAVSVQPNELHSRMQMTDVVNRRRMRHAHMVNITPEIMCQGMRADYALVDRLSQKILDRVRRARRIRAT